MLAKAVVSSEGSSGKPTHVVVGRIPLPAVVELRVSVPCQLLARSPPSSLPQGSPVRQLTTRQLVSSEQAGEGAPARQKSASEPLISEVTPHHLLPHSIHEK